jgi:hypothetical protein
VSDLEAITKVCANCTARTMVALKAAADLTGDSETDTINRAVQLYAAIVACHEAGSARIKVESKTGAVMRIDVNRPWWRLW